MYEFKKIFIFDLDDTLYLHHADLSFKKEYHRNILTFLKDLKKDNKLICLVTYNVNPKRLLNDSICLFDYVYSPKLLSLSEYLNDHNIDIEHYTPWICNDKVTLCKDKSIVIKEILSKFNCESYQAIFFDDNKVHIKAVQKIGIETVLVNPLKGIPIPKIEKKKQD
jgi:hypothetical protein